MDEDIPLPFDLPAVARKKVSAAFDGGRITSDGGVMLLAQAERRLAIADQLARVIPDGRDADRVVHLLPDILRARILAIACGYEDADDLDQLRFDPAFKLACGRLPDTGRDLCSQPTGVMRVLGWRRKVIRHNARRVGRGFRRGLDTRTIFVMRCPATKEIYHVGYEPGPSAARGLDSAPDRLLLVHLPIVP
jgi:hypothetical protein